MQDIIFDTADKKDIPELIRLRLAYMKDDFGSVSVQQEKDMRNHLPSYFERHLNSDLIAFVARKEDRLIAAAYLLVVEKPASPFLPNGLDGEVLSVFTEEEYRRKGICTKLISRLIDYGRERKLCRISLCATSDGYPVYRKLGFKDKVQKYTDMRITFI